jgi:uncharacterized protein YndB with AHSA1/START domain
MRTLRIEMTLAAPPERVFDVLGAHAEYDRFRPIRRAELIREGEPPPNGVGAMRRIWAGALRFEEEITAYERPVRLDYVIRRLNFPFEHEGGSILISPAGEGTAVDWTTRYRVPIPLLGAPLAAAFAVALRRSFRQLLEDTERIARSL